MKKRKLQGNLRTILLSALMIAALSCMSVFLAVNAAEGTEPNVDVSDSDSAAEVAEAIELTQEVQIKSSYVTFTQIVDAKNYRFKPNATYNGSFKSELLANEIPIYDAFYASMVTNHSNDPVTVDISEMGYVYDQQSEVGDLVLSAYAAFSMDHPEVYWIGGYSLSMSGSNGILTSVTITPSQRYEGAYNELNTVLSGIDAAVSTIRSTRASSSRYDTAKAIHDYISNMMVYDKDEADNGGHGEAHTIAPLFGGGNRGHMFVCEGYANSFKLLCDKFGVPAVHVKGYAYQNNVNLGGHSWNYVKMNNGQWYGVDCTWDDQDSRIFYTYFLIGSNTEVFNNEIFSGDHRPDDQVMSNPTNNPLVYPPLATEKYIPATGISLSETSLTLTTGDTATLTATITPSNSSDIVEWTSSDESVATVSNGVVTAVGNGSATITATAGSVSATCAVTVESPQPAVYDVTPDVVSGASKLYEPWGIRYYAVFNGADTGSIIDKGIAMLKDTYYSDGMTPAEFCEDANAHIFLSTRNELTFESATSAYPNGKYYATLTDGIYSYDISALYYVVPFAEMEDGQVIYGTIKSNSMENILTQNLTLSSVTQKEKAICRCILDLKDSVAAHYQASEIPGASIDMNIPRGSSQTAATSITAAGDGISPNVFSAASRLIEPWGLRYFADYGSSENIRERGMVILHENYYNSSYSTSPDEMRLNANAYVFRDSDGTLVAQGGSSSRFKGTLTEGITSRNIADVYYVVPFVVLNDGSYVYGSVKSNSMLNIMNYNLNSSSVSATERAVSQDIIDLYNAVQAYYA